MTDFMQELGSQVLGNGYPLIPLILREKRPALSNWRNINATEELVKSWRGGIGIRTGFVVFIDVDILNPVADRIREWCVREIGPAPVRIGYAPKLGLMYRSEVLLPTRISKGYLDGAEKRAAIEALGDGRQFVAFNIHPDTGKEYVWLEGVDPTNIRVEDLTLIRPDQIERLFAFLDSMAFQEGWSLPTTAAPRTGGDESLLGVRNTPLDDLTDDQIAAYIRQVPNDDRFAARGDWLTFGMAIHHQFGGSEEGRELFLEWSEQHYSHNDENFRKAWDSFGNNYSNPNFQPVTFRYIIKLAGEIKRAEQAAELKRIDAEIDALTTFEALKQIAFDISILSLDDTEREIYASRLQAASKRLGTRLPIMQVRKMLRPPVADAEMPKWLEDWVFLAEVGQFYNTVTGARYDRHAFDLLFNHWLVDVTPSHFATQTVKLPKHHMTAYLPGQGPIWTDQSGLSWVNTYRDTSPAIPARYSDRDLAAIERVQAHGNHLFGPGAERDIAILHSALAYIVQTGKRINWMIVLQGAEAVGKTFYAKLLRTVLGGEPHVFELTTELLTESSFTSWAEGHQVVYIEELKLHGKRYDVLNKMKSYITNDFISVHVKRESPRTVPNTASYIAFTNHRDALPIGEGDTRYFIMLSQWQDSEAVKQFKEENPDYYRRLWATLDECPGALRRWLMEYDLHPEFSPFNRAPASAGRDRVLREAKPEFQQDIEDIITDGLYPWISNDLVIAHLLREAVSGDLGSLPPPESIRAILQRMQFTPVEAGRIRITKNGQSRLFYCWSRNPEIIRASLPRLRDIIETALASVA